MSSSEQVRESILAGAGSIGTGRRTRLPDSITRRPMWKQSPEEAAAAHQLVRWLADDDSGASQSVIAVRARTSRKRR